MPDDNNPQIPVTSPPKVDDNSTGPSVQNPGVNDVPPVSSPTLIPEPVTSQEDVVSSPTSEVVNESTIEPDNPVVAAPHAPKKYGGKKVIATIFGIFLLIGGVAAGVLLVRQQRLQTSLAWDCSKYNFGVARNGTVTVANGSQRTEPLQKAKVYINNVLVATFDVPALSPGGGTTLGTVTVPSDLGFTWRVDGTVDCEDSGSYDSLPTPIPTVIPTVVPSATPIPSDKPIPTITKIPPTATPEPTPGTISALCSEVKAYDIDWNLLTASDLAGLKTGDKVRFAVSGTTSSGNFDKARFTINGSLRSEVTTKKPGSQEYYDEYTIPAGTVNFSVKGEIHHTQLEWI